MRIVYISLKKWEIVRLLIISNIAKNALHRCTYYFFDFFEKGVGRDESNVVGYIKI